MFSLISRKNLSVIEVRFFGWDDLFYLLEIHQLLSYFPYYTAQKMKFSIKNFFSKWDQIRSFLQIWSHLLKTSLMENFIFCPVSVAKLVDSNQDGMRFSIYKPIQIFFADNRLLHLLKCYYPVKQKKIVKCHQQRILLLILYH